MKLSLRVGTKFPIALVSLSICKFFSFFKNIFRVIITQQWVYNGEEKQKHNVLHQT